VQVELAHPARPEHTRRVRRAPRRAAAPVAVERPKP
jgi:hypothetical protein